MEGGPIKMLPICVVGGGGGGGNRYKEEGAVDAIGDH